MSTRVALVCGAVAVVVLAATGVQRWPHHTAMSSTAAAPEVSTMGRPAVLSSGPSPENASNAPDCDKRASLRPQGPLPAPGQMPAGSAMARIAQRGHLVVGIAQDAYPLAFRDRDLTLAGFDIDIVHDIAGAIFGDPEAVVFRPHAAAGRLDTVRSGEVDVVVAAMTITCPRREKVDFSTVYYEASQRVLANRGSGITGLDDLRGKRVCAARGTTSLAAVLADRSKPIPVGEPTPSDCLVLLQLGEVDAVSSDDTQLAGMVTEDPRTEIIGPRPGEKPPEEPYGIAISKDAPDLVRFVNAVLDRRSHDGRWRTSYERWLGRLGPSPAPPTPRYRD